MKMLLAVNLETLEDYVKNYIIDVEVCDVIVDRRSLQEKVLEHKPDVVLISNTLSGDESFYDIITKMTSNDFPDARIVFLYGEDDPGRPHFINFLISRGVFDYHVGKNLCPEIILELLSKPRERRDVKKDIIPDEQLPKTSMAAEESIEAYEKPKNSIKFVQDLLKEMSEEEKKKMGLIERIEVQSVRGLTIAVGGTSENIGSTHIAFHIAYFLTRLNKNFKVAVLQYNDKKDFQTLESYGLSKAQNENSFHYRKVDFYYDTNINDLKKLTDLKNNRKYYDYYILDLGCIKKTDSDSKVSLSKNYDCMHWADFSILITSCKPWQRSDLVQALYEDDRGLDEKFLKSYYTMKMNEGDIASRDWRLFFNYADDDFYKELYKGLNNVWNVYKVPYCADLFRPYQEMDELLSDALEPILPHKDKVIKGSRGRR